MNKTVNINLGGMFFHIDEDAYQKMTRYFDAIKHSLSNSSGQDEIIKDIEMRIGELISVKHTSDKQVINLKEVDEIIAIMGQPEDYRIDDETNDTSSAYYSTQRKTKKLYRDTENGTIGGVATGLGHYFGIEPIWLKIMFLIFVFAGFGTGILAYIILWIVVPEAVSTSEKLEMTGEPVTISNIEKKVREEFENVSEKFKNANYDEMGNRIKTGAEKIGTSFGDFILTVLKIFAKILGILLIITGLTVLVFLLIGVFTLGTNVFIDFPWQNFIEAGNFTDYPIWSFGLLMFFAVGIPFFFLTLLGFKLLSPNMKSIGNIAKYTLLAIWLIAISLTVYIGIKQATQVSFENKVVQKERININPADTLLIKFKFNDYYTKDIDNREDFKFVQDSANTQLIYSNNVSLRILPTDQKMPYLQIEKTARGKSMSDARLRAESIKYSIKIEGNQLALDNYLLTETSNKFRGQEVATFLYLPTGTIFKVDSSVQNYYNSDNDIFNLNFSSDKSVYKVGNSKIECLNCPIDENEFDDLENDSTQTAVIINKDGVSVKNDTVINSKNNFQELKINKDGIIIKTK